MHRHEPAVALADVSIDNVNTKTDQSQASSPVQIVHEDDALLVVDKPSTLPIHPCGGRYFIYSLFFVAMNSAMANKSTKTGLDFVPLY